VDEIQSGFGRTGKLFAFEHSGIEPDVLLLSKAIGGSLPLSVVVYHQDLDLWNPGAHAGTFRGNQLAMAAGIASLRYIQEYDLATHAEMMGIRLCNHLRQIQVAAPWIGDICGRGLMVGVEMVDPTHPGNRRGIHPHAPLMAQQLQQECFRRGLILELGGRYGSVVRFLPPLIVTPQQIDTIAEIFQAAVMAAIEKMDSSLTVNSKV
jgi:diaminobutyrate-2-oxoglutarate transaminase